MSDFLSEIQLDLRQQHFFLFSNLHFPATLSASRPRRLHSSLQLIAATKPRGNIRKYKRIVVFECGMQIARRRLD